LSYILISMSVKGKLRGVLAWFRYDLLPRRVNGHAAGRFLERIIKRLPRFIRLPLIRVILRIRKSRLIKLLGRFKHRVIASRLIRLLRRLNHQVKTRWRKLPSYLKLSTVPIILALIVFTGIRLYQSTWYGIDDKTQALLTTSIANKGQIQQTDTAFSFNLEDQREQGELGQYVLAASQLDSTGAAPYQATLNKEPKKGITFADSEDKFKITMTPQFDAQPGKQQDGRLVYPVSSTVSQIYTLKRNGLKEDIILSKAPRSGQATFSWKLDTGDVLEARLMDDGSVGIYSGDELLNGDITVGDDKTQALLDNARKNGPKTELKFVIPKPYIKDSNGQLRYAGVSYQLKDSILTLTASDLGDGERSPPSVVNTKDSQETDASTETTSEVQQASNGQPTKKEQPNPDLQPSSYLPRAYTQPVDFHQTDNDVQQLSEVRKQETSDHLSSDEQKQMNVDLRSSNPAHNTGGSQPLIYPISIDPSILVTTTADFRTGSDDGMIDYGTVNEIKRGALTQGVTTWGSTTSFSVERWGHTSVAYNGYLYVLGGEQAASDIDCKNGGSSYTCNDVQYAPINSNGTIGAWTATTFFTTPHSNHTSVAYNGYLYVIGGLNYPSMLNDVQYAPINSNGTIGTWNPTTSLAPARIGHTSVAYNGYLYVSGGCGSLDVGGNCTSHLNDVQYAPINSNGTIGAWTTTSSFTTARDRHTSVVYNGYLYVIGGVGEWLQI
jgi:hypothetical protein